jgi:hypothetical protein
MLTLLLFYYFALRFFQRLLDQADDEGFLRHAGIACQVIFESLK